jgi:hypothetical protein
MTCLANEVHDGPVLLPLLQVFGSQIYGLVTPQSARHQKSQQGSVALSLQLFNVGTLPQ